MPQTYSSAELMIVNSARMLRDGDVVFVGVGQPNLACNLAKRTHAPNLTMIYEAGVIGVFRCPIARRWYIHWAHPALARHAAALFVPLQRTGDEEHHDHDRPAGL